MPILSPFLSGAYPWNATAENGFPNPQIPRFLETIPQYILSDVGLSTWSAQAVWLFTLYLVGAVAMAAAVAELFPLLRSRFWPIVLAGFAYQLTPSLMFGLQDTSAYGLQIGTYWALPLLLLFTLRAERTREWWWGPVLGASVLLALTEFPATFVPLVLFGGFLAVLVGTRAASRTQSPPLWPLVGASFGWILVFNAWWAIPEFSYRGDLLQNLALNTPISLGYPDHLGGLLLMDWAWPAPSGFLAYLQSPAAILGGAAIFLTCVAALAIRERIPGRGILVGFWLTTLVLAYGAASPFNEFYQQLFGSTVFANLVRNSVHFVPLLDVATAATFGLGAYWVVDGPIGQRGGAWIRELLVVSTPRTAHSIASAWPRGPRAVLSRSVCGTILFTSVLVVASLPLVSGGVLENVNFNGHVVTAVSPPEIGVKVPGYYNQARSWLASAYPQTTTMVFPMPSTWLSGDSNLSWGYEGSSAIYQTLLQEPLISNNAGTLTAPLFPATSAAYSIAAGGGPPGNATQLRMNSSLYLWPGFQHDEVAYHSSGGPDGLAEIEWSMYLGQDYGINGHQFTWTVPAALPSDVRYLGFWEDSETSGQLQVSWAVNSTLVGWYLIDSTQPGWQFVVLPMSSPPTFNYDPSVLSTAQFPSATDLWFEFKPSGPVQNSTGEMKLADFTVYDADPLGTTYYLESLGAHLVVADSSIVAEPTDSLQNLSAYSELISTLASEEVASFGNLTVYSLPQPNPTVLGTGHWTNSSNYYTAWSSRSGSGSVFVVQPPNWLPSHLTTPQLSATMESPGEYTLKVSSSGPFLLVLLQNFDPLWQASTGGAVLSSHITVNGFANGWLVNRTGNYSIVVEFGPVSTFMVIVEVTPIFAAVLGVATITPLRNRLVQAIRRIRIRRDSSALPMEN